MPVRGRRLGRTSGRSQGPTDRAEDILVRCAESSQQIRQLWFQPFLFLPFYDAIRRTTDKIVILSSGKKMALFSLRHSVKTFSPKTGSLKRKAAMGQTAAHLRYIVRPGAARTVIRTRVEDSDAMTAEKAETEAYKRKGRVAERFIVALPVEATSKQREELGIAFAELVTNRIAGYVLAIHDIKGNDVKNPHMHLVVFDSFKAPVGRGRPKSVVGMARKGAVQKTCAAWSNLHNTMMRGWGYQNQSMITHLSYKDQDIDRIPSIHEGPGGRKLAKESKRPRKKPEWEHIDHGRSRQDANALISKINYMKKELKYGRDRDRLGSRDTFDQKECRSSGTKRRQVHRSTRGTHSTSETAARRHERGKDHSGGSFKANRGFEDIRRDHQTYIGAERDEEISCKKPANVPPWHTGFTRDLRRDWLSLTILSRRLRVALRKLSYRGGRPAPQLPVENHPLKTGERVQPNSRVAE